MVAEGHPPQPVLRDWLGRQGLRQHFSYLLLQLHARLSRFDPGVSASISIELWREAIPRRAASSSLLRAVTKGAMQAIWRSGPARVSMRPAST